jgi:hypothetical protein
MHLLFVGIFTPLYLGMNTLYSIEEQRVKQRVIPNGST